MRRAEKAIKRQMILRGVLTLALVMLIGLFADGFATVSHAQSQGRVTANSVNIRREPNTTSDVVGSALKDKVIDINNQVLGADGKMWYQTFVNSETLGYIRSDFVEIIDGTTPPTVTAPTTPTTPTTPPATTTPSGNVEALNPVSATVKGSSQVRVRSGASTSDDIVTLVPNGLVLTVTGRSTDSAGEVWYKVSFSDNGSEVEGFIRNDFVTVSGELTPYVEPEPETPPADDPGEPAVEPEPAEKKDWETALIDGKWYLIDNVKQTQQSIDELFYAVKNNSSLYKEEHKKAESEKVVIIIMVFLLVAAASGIAMLVFKIKDMSDDAYFSQVERETLKRRGEAKSQGNSSRVMHTVGAERPSRPVGGRSQEAPQGRPSGNPQGQRPQGAPQGRPSGNSQGQRPQGHPSGSQQGQRPQGGSQGRPSGNPQGQRPQEAPQGRPSGNPQGQRSQGNASGNQKSQNNSGQKTDRRQQGWQSKNFMSEDDEFEFEFLNYDGNDSE